VDSDILPWKKIPNNRSEFISTKHFFDKYNTFNMYLSIFLVLIGIMGNTVTMRVLVYARKRLPKINCLSCLIILTLANIVQLLSHFYMSTLTRIIYHFAMEQSILMSVYVFDSNVFVCKLFNYLKFFSRFVALSSILVFSFVRMLAIYYPFKSFKRFEKYLLVILCSISASYPLCYLFTYDIIETGHDFVNLSITNSSKIFHVATLTPILQNLHCTIPAEYEDLFFIINTFSCLFVFISFFIVSTSIISLIVHEIKSKKESKTNLRVNRGSQIKRNSSNDMRSSERVSSESFIKKFTTINYLNLQRTIVSPNPSFQNKKMLITLASSFILFNVPYFCVIFLVVNILNSFAASNEQEPIDRIRLKSYFTFVEIFKLFNYSITGLLIFVSGKMFRIHFRFYFKEIFSLKN